jgi:outer membrane protein insertion porin family
MLPLVLGAALAAGCAATPPRLANHDVPATQAPAARTLARPAEEPAGDDEEFQYTVRGQEPPYGVQPPGYLPTEPGGYNRFPMTPSGGPVQPAQYTPGPYPNGNYPPATYPPGDGYPPNGGYAPGGGYVPNGGYAPGTAYPPGSPWGGPSNGSFGSGPFITPPGSSVLGPGPGAVEGILPPPPSPEAPYYEEPAPLGVPIPLDVFLDEAQTGRFMFGLGVNSEAGLVGNIVVDERNFDWRRFPRSFEEIASGRAWRGAGQGFRVEAVPGSEVQRYTVSFTEPYLFSTPISMRLSGFLYDRRFFDWTEGRGGGRVELGYRLTPDLSVSFAVRGEEIDITDPRVMGVTALDDAVGSHELYSGRVSLVHDTRDIPFAPTEGHFIQLSYEQVFGSFDYPRGEIEYRTYFLLSQRPDGSGRHTLGYSYRFGFSGSETPIFENYFAGGYSTLRGFDFRGASPVDGGVTTGGRFMALGSVEYLFPISADDMIKGVAFVDFGTIEEDIEFHADNFRVAPGLGLRINVPALGPAPIALDFAFPVIKAPTDETQVFSFFVGFNR